MFIEIVGYIAAILTTFSFLPQALKIVRTKDTHSISLKMYLMFTSGVFAWLIYGLLQGLMQIIIANFITFLLSGAILVMKLKNQKQEKLND